MIANTDAGVSGARAVSSIMSANVGSTLRTIAALRSPVVRSCHIGNNTSNVWGWLALARNARLLQYDHTLYGVDENCLAWTVLGDAGYVRASYAPDGSPRPADAGLHVNDLMATVDRRHTALLNYALFAQYDGEDLMRHHLRTAADLSAAANSSTVTWDSNELLEHAALFTDVVRGFAAANRLDLLFDRWVKTTRKGYVAMRRLRSLTHDAGRVTAVDADGATVFAGTIEDLVSQLTISLAAIRERLRHAQPLPAVSYPWISLPFAYLATAVHEYAADRTQRVFWHAAGSVSQYYVNSSAFATAFTAVRDALADGGFLPRGGRLLMVPTFCCQLIATTTGSLEYLEQLIDVWRGYLRRRRSDVTPLLEQLQTTERPFEVAAEHERALSAADARMLRQAMDEFNEADPNQLPVAHIAGRHHPNYNKYGVSQQSLRGSRFAAAPGFEALTWAEGELLVKTLAHLTLDRRG